MSPSLPAYYLPITLVAASDFLVHGQVPDSPIERAALFTAVMALTTPDPSPAALARTIIEAEPLFAAPDRDGAREALQELRAGLPEDLHATGMDRLADHGIFFVSAQQMASGLWRGANGRYTDEFQQRCRDTLIEQELALPGSADEGDGLDDGSPDTDDEVIERPRRVIRLRGTLDQVRAVTVIAAARSEPVALTATAGSGKTHLMLALAEHLGGGYTHLAPTDAHRQAFLRRVGTSGMTSRTLASVAHEAAADWIDQGRETHFIRPPQVEVTELSLAKQANRLGIPAIGDAVPAEVLVTVFSAINRWSYSRDPVPTARHLDRWILSMADEAIYVALAQRVWDRMFAPQRAGEDLVCSVRLYHLVKWLDLQGINLRPMGTLLIDEAHDLSEPWYSLFERYSGGWLTMGDPYQRIEGRAPRTSAAKSLTMTQSVRAGTRLEPLVRRTLSLHSATLMDGQFSGSHDHATRYHPYAPGTELPQHGLRVFGSAWTLLDDALRLKAKGARFRVLPASYRTVLRMAKDAIVLRTFGDRPSQYNLRKFFRWEDLAIDLRQSGHVPMLNAFERGLGIEDLDALTNAQAEEGEQNLTLGLLKDCKNLEFSQVVMARCCFGVSGQGSRDELVKAIYVAMTRVRDELWLPGDALDRLADELQTIPTDSARPLRPGSSSANA